MDAALSLLGMGVGEPKAVLEVASLRSHAFLTGSLCPGPARPAVHPPRAVPRTGTS